MKAEPIQATSGYLNLAPRDLAEVEAERLKRAPRVDYFALAVADMRDSLAAVRKARGDIEYLIALHGPVEIARAARKGLEGRHDAE